MSSLDDQGPGDPKYVARPQGEQKAAFLEISPANDIDVAQADCGVVSLAY
jgi:hypothetical protein